MFKAGQGVTVADGDGVQSNCDIQALSGEKHFQVGGKNK